MCGAVGPVRLAVGDGDQGRVAGGHARRDPPSREADGQNLTDPRPNRRDFDVDGVEQSRAVKTFDALFAELSERARTRPAGSGTVAALDGGVHGLGKKILEEAGEVWLAAEHEGDDALADEISQLLYWTQVLMISRGTHPRRRVPEDCRTACCGSRCPTRARSVNRRPRSCPKPGTVGARDPKDLTVIDPVNQVEFFFLRPKDIAIYVGSGQLDLGITGRDLAAESDAPVRERLALGFGSSTFRYAAPAGRDWRDRGSRGQADRHRVSQPGPKGPGRPRNRGDGDPARRRGGDLGAARASPTRSPTSSGPVARLGLHDLVAFGEPLCDSEAVLIERETGAPMPATASRSRPIRRSRSGRGVRPAVSDAGLRLPAHRARAGDRGHPRTRVPDDRAAGRPGVGRGARAGAAPRRQRDHGRD